MNTYYTTRDFEFLRNRPVVLESEALAEIEKLQAKLERAALSESADVSREIDDGNKIASLETALAAANERIAELERKLKTISTMDERSPSLLQAQGLEIKRLQRENELWLIYVLEPYAAVHPLLH